MYKPNYMKGMLEVEVVTNTNHYSTHIHHFICGIM
jgi:hypothetical protein